MSDIWEPWVPEVGQRVRIRLSAECPFNFGAPHLAGRTGTVVDAVTNERLLELGHTHGHRFEVKIDGYGWSIYTASELEPAS